MCYVQVIIGHTTGDQCGLYLQWPRLNGAIEAGCSPDSLRMLHTKLRNMNDQTQSQDKITLTWMTTMQITPNRIYGGRMHCQKNQDQIEPECWMFKNPPRETERASIGGKPIRSVIGAGQDEMKTTATDTERRQLQTCGNSTLD